MVNLYQLLLYNSYIKYIYIYTIYTKQYKVYCFNNFEWMEYYQSNINMYK